MKQLLLALLILPIFAIGETITLTADNSVSLRDGVTWSSISRLQYELLQLSHRLSPDDVIYLVLDTPGGSVSAGEMLTETIKTIPQQIHAVVLFAASMGFQITQASHTRLIIGSGTLMSHRAKVGLRAQLDGEFESRLLYIKESIRIMESRSAKRVELTLGDYKKKIVNEWWEMGQNAVTAKMADAVVTVKCDETLVKETVLYKIQSLFGVATLRFSKCPLITIPINNISNKKQRENLQLRKYLDRLFYNKRDFIDNYIKTGLITQ